MAEPVGRTRRPPPGSSRTGSVSRLAAVAFGGAACAGLALLATLVWHPRMLVLWNASPSSPIGLYRVVPGAKLQAGDMAVAWLPGAARELAARRHYLPRGVPLVKQVAATAGDRLCASGRSVLVNGRVEAVRRIADLSGRRLPGWTGCRTLGEGEVFLLSPEANAFDGRYTGISRRSDIVGKARLLWRR